MLIVRNNDVVTIRETLPSGTIADDEPYGLFQKVGNKITFVRKPEITFTKSSTPTTNNYIEVAFTITQEWTRDVVHRISLVKDTLEATSFGVTWYEEVGSASFIIKDFNGIVEINN